MTKKDGLEINFGNKLKIDIYSKAENDLFIDLLISKNKKNRERIEKFLNKLSDLSDYIYLDLNEKKVGYKEDIDKKSIFDGSINIKNKDNKELNIKEEKEYFENKFDYIESNFNKEKLKEYKIFINGFLEKEKEVKNIKKLYIQEDIIFEREEYFYKGRFDRYIFPFLFLDINKKGIPKYYFKSFYFDKKNFGKSKLNISVLDDFILCNDNYFSVKGLLKRVDLTSDYIFFDKKDIDCNDCKNSYPNTEKIKIIKKSYEDYIINNKKYEKNCENHIFDKKNEIIKKFTDSYNEDKIKKISLENYCIGQENQTNFCYELEFGSDVKKLGSISGANSSKYGVYWSKNKQEYKIKEGVENKDEAIERVRNDLVFIYNSKNISDLKDKEFFISDLVVRKVFYMYHDAKIIPIYTDEKLKEVFDSLGLVFKDYYDAQEKLLKIFKEIYKKDNLKISTLSFMYFLLSK